MTSRFRDCLAKRVIYAEADLNSALEALDSSREVLTDALNVGSIEGAQKELDRMGGLLTPANRAMQRAVTRHIIVAINTVHPRLGRRNARKLLLANFKQLNDYIESSKTRNHWLPALTPVRLAGVTLISLPPRSITCGIQPFPLPLAQGPISSWFSE